MRNYFFGDGQTRAFRFACCRIGDTRVTPYLEVQIPAPSMWCAQRVAWQYGYRICEILEPK